MYASQRVPRLAYRAREGLLWVLEALTKSWKPLQDLVQASEGKIACAGVVPGDCFEYTQLWLYVLPLRK